MWTLLSSALSGREQALSQTLLLRLQKGRKHYQERRMHTRRVFAVEESLDHVFKERLVNLFICLNADLLYGYQELQWAFSLPFSEELPEEL